MTQPTTIRERDADAAPFAWANPGDDQTELDRRTLLAALDALVEAASDLDRAIGVGWVHGVWRMTPQRIAAFNAMQDAIADAKEASDG